MFKYFLYKFGQFCLRWLPPPVSLKLGLLMSDLQYYFSFRDRHAVKNNLRVITGKETGIPSLTREVFRNFGRYLIEFFTMRKMVNEEYIKKHVKVQGLERIEEALKLGKGGIVITAHLGNWELGAVLLSMLGYPLVVIALPHKERPVNDLFNHQRETKGITIVPTHMAVRRCLETLKGNKLIALVADRDFGLNGEPMDFLGRKALIPPGPAMFSSATGAPIIPVFLIREEDNTFTPLEKTFRDRGSLTGFTLTVGEPIYPPLKIEKQQEHEVLLFLMRKYVSVIEEKIRLYPAQWLMFRPFWIKDFTRPASVLSRLFRLKKKAMKQLNKKEGL